MSNPDKNPIFGFGKTIVKAVRDFGHSLTAYPSQVCLQCKAPVHQDYQFCSEACGLDYWRMFRSQHHKKSGRNVCGYPGCSKQCYVEPSGRVHDYCSRTHASEHKVMQDRAQRHHWQQQQPGSGHHGNSHRNHPGTKAQQDSSSWLPWSNKSATGPINFYNRDEPYYQFTNFYSAPIKLDMKTWPTTEHYFQAQKFVGTPYEEQIRHLPRPRQAFDFTRDPKVSRWRRSDWESIKEDVMYKALLAKFTQHNDLKKLLLGTGERKLVERSPYDSYWGDGGNGTGMNRLGELLMQLRCELRSGKKGKRGSFQQENLQHSSQSGQGWSSTPPTSVHGGHTHDSDLSRQPLRKQHSHPDVQVVNQPSNFSDDATAGIPPYHVASGGPPCHVASGGPPCHVASGGLPCHPAGGGPPGHPAGGGPPCHPAGGGSPASNIPGTTAGGPQPSTVTGNLHPILTAYQPVHHS